jgi:hypothetical protein
VSSLMKRVVTVEYVSNFYPISHWKQLGRFAVGEERDPRGLFRLTDDTWETWPYALNGMPSRARHFRFHFGRLQSFVKLYAKWYCYHKILGSAGTLRSSLANLPALLFRADRYIREHGFRSIDDISPSVVFQDLWDAQIRGDYTEVPLPRKATAVQDHTRTFWLRISLEFGTPHLVPPTAGMRNNIVPPHQF